MGNDISGPSPHYLILYRLLTIETCKMDQCLNQFRAQEELPLVAGARAARGRAPLRAPPADARARGGAQGQGQAGERPQAAAGAARAAGRHGQAGRGHGGRGGRAQEGPRGREEGGQGPNSIHFRILTEIFMKIFKNPDLKRRHVPTYNFMNFFSTPSFLSTLQLQTKIRT